MTRKEFSRKFAKAAGIRYNQAGLITDIVFEVLENSLFENDRVLTSGFGTFELKKRKKKRVLHPVTGEEIIAPERYHVEFRPSDRLSKRMRDPDNPEYHINGYDGDYDDEEEEELEMTDEDFEEEDFEE